MRLLLTSAFADGSVEDRDSVEGPFGRYAPWLAILAIHGLLGMRGRFGSHRRMLRRPEACSPAWPSGQDPIPCFRVSLPVLPPVLFYPRSPRPQAALAVLPALMLGWTVLTQLLVPQAVGFKAASLASHLQAEERQRREDTEEERKIPV